MGRLRVADLLGELFEAGVFLATCGGSTGGSLLLLNGVLVNGCVSFGEALPLDGCTCLDEFDAGISLGTPPTTTVDGLGRCCKRSYAA